MTDNRNTSFAAELMESVLEFREAAVVLAAVHLDLFDRIGTGATPKELAENGGNAEAIGRLCQALVTLGLLERKENTYRCTPESSLYLTADGEIDLRPILRLFREIYRMWDDLPDVLRQGQENYSFRDDDEDPFDPQFLEAMEARAQFDKDEVGRILGDRLNGGRLLDLGGGSGVYSRAILHHAPESRAVIADLERLLEETQKYIDQDQLRDRMEVRGIDLTTDKDYGRDFDMILLSAILHMFGPDQCRRILSRCFKALGAGGSVVIRDYVLEEDRLEPKDAVLFDLNMLLATENGRTYTESQYRQFLGEAGFESPDRLSLSGTTDELLVAQKLV